MRVECFEFKRCCCCVPLRHGLLALGYLKLAFSLLVILPLYCAHFHLPPAGVMSRSEYVGVIAILILSVLAILGDLALTIVFLVGCHKKSPKLLKVFNYYSIAVLILYALAYIFANGSYFYATTKYWGFINSVLFARFFLTFGALCIGLQVYIILMNKAEMTKLLEHERGFTFSNIAQEAECKMVDEEGNTIEHDIKINELENGVHHENDSGSYVANKETEHSVLKENKCIKQQLNGNYVKLV